MCRVPVISQYGFETEDIGLFVASCDACSHVTARLHAFTDLAPDLDINDLEAELSSRALDASCGWVPPHCPSCGAAHPRPISGVFARYLPEVGLDVHIHLIRGGNRITDIEYFVMNVAGEVRTLPRPKDSIDFLHTVGTPLSLRAVWSSFVAKDAFASEIQTLSVQDGYFLAMRPFANSDADVGRMAQPFYEWISELQKDGGFDVIAYFRDLDDDQLNIKPEASYRAWLDGYASEIDRALIDPMIIVDSNAFVSVLNELAFMYGLSAERDSGADTLYVKFSGGDISVRLNLAPLLFRIIHEGYTFHRGIKQYLMDELRAISVTAEVVPLLRRAVPAYDFKIQHGHYIEVLNSQGERVSAVDGIRLATTYEPRDIQQFCQMVDELIPGQNPLPFTLGTPRAGQLAPVIPCAAASA